MQHKTIAIIGAGQVGSTLAFCLYNLDICDILLLNHNKQKAVSNVCDIKDCSLDKSHNIRYGVYEDLDNVDILINCAGNSSMLKTHDRYSELENSTRIANDILNNVNKTSFNGIFINIMNPCDDITYIFKDINIPNNRILGTGTALETSRLRCIVKSYFSNYTQSYVVGKHGEFNDIVCTDSLCANNKELLIRLTRDRVWEIYKGKGYTNFGICNVLIELVKNILFDTDEMMCVSTLCTEKYDIHNQCISLPCRIGKDGITDVIINQNTKDTLEKLWRTII